MRSSSRKRPSSAATARELADSVASALCRPTAWGKKKAADREAAGPVSIAIESRRLTIRPAMFAKLAEFFLSRAFRGKKPPRQLSVAVVDDRRMAELNLRYLGHRGPTDVLSFSFAPPNEGGDSIGEIIIDAEQAAREAILRRVDVCKELAWYLAHGINHLAGGRDDTPALRAAMHRREKRWLKEAQDRGLLHGLAAERHGKCANSI